MKLRPENLLEAIGIDFKGLTEDERAMQTLLLEEYKKAGKTLLEEVSKLRDVNPKTSLGENISALYKELEEN